MRSVNGNNGINTMENSEMLGLKHLNRKKFRGHICKSTYLAQLYIESDASMRHAGISEEIQPPVRKLTGYIIGVSLSLLKICYFSDEVYIHKEKNTSVHPVSINPNTHFKFFSIFRSDIEKSFWFNISISSNIEANTINLV